MTTDDQNVSSAPRCQGELDVIPLPRYQQLAPLVLREVTRDGTSIIEGDFVHITQDFCTALPDSAMQSITTNARLPASYEAAKVALRDCAQIDECLAWANKAEALASYARQAHDDEMRKMADRIQARALKRCGELLREIEPSRGANQHIRAGALPKVTRTLMATNAGLSEHQRKTALRVANVPETEFERALESDQPPTVTALAERGKIPCVRPPADLSRRSYSNVTVVTEALGGLRRFVEATVARVNPQLAAKRADAFQRTAMLGMCNDVTEWVTNLTIAINPAPISNVSVTEAKGEPLAGVQRGTNATLPTENVEALAPSAPEPGKRKRGRPVGSRDRQPRKKRATNDQRARMSESGSDSRSPFRDEPAGAAIPNSVIDPPR